MTTPIRLDLWPAEVVSDPDAPDPKDRVRSYPVRVIVTLDEIFVFADGRPPRLVFRDQLVDYAPAIPLHRATKEQRRSGANWAVVTTDTGHALTFTRAGGCGCGSRLKLMSTASVLAIANGAQGESIASAASAGDR